jgi:hypothetical protein
VKVPFFSKTINNCHVIEEFRVPFFGDNKNKTEVERKQKTLNKSRELNALAWCPLLGL